MKNRTSSKETLAKLMATENLLVEHADVPTAGFDLLKRKLLLPNWKNISDNVYTLLISHEVGHALFTPKDEWEAEIMKTKDSSFKTVVNIVEDVRIEKMIQSKYPGTIRAFKAGYDELQKANFFGTAGRDINSYGLLDRLNIHFKIGHFGYINVPFSEKEKPWLDKLSSCKSFSEVLALAKDLMEFVEKNPESQGQSQEGDPSDAGDSGEEKVQKKVGVVTEDSESGEGSGSQEVDPSELDAIIDPNNLLGKQESDNDPSNPIRVETQQKLDESLRSLIDQNIKNTAYVNLPATELDKLIVPYKKVHTQIREYYSKFYPQVFEWSANQVQTFKNTSKNVVNQMANLFEMKKKARLDVRSLTAKTGQLDMNRVHSYRYNEDVFKKVTTTPQGKSHGLVMFIDLSSSMYDSLSGTFEQLLNLVLFCRRISIPFEVYGFTDSYSAKDGIADHPRNFGTILYDARFCLRQYFSHKMTGVEFNEALQNILCMMQYYNRTSYTGIPVQEQLNCTPLNPAIIAGIQVVNSFRSANNLDVVNTIFLTDGDDTHGITYLNETTGEETFLGNSHYPYHYYSASNPRERNFIRDLKSRKQWEVKASTPTLLNILREQTGAKVIGFFLARKRDAQMRIENMSRDRNKSAALLDSFKKMKFAEINNVMGYDAYYIIPNGSSLSVSSDEFEAEIDTTVDWDDEKQAKKAMKTAQKEFANQMSEKVVSRVLLNRFIDHIS